MATVSTSTPRQAAEPSVGELVAEASASLSTILRGEIELAKLELKSSVKNAAISGAAFGAAAVMLAFAAIFGLVALAEGLVAAGLWRWLAYLVVFGFLMLIIGLSVVVGISRIKKIRAPEQTIETGKDTVAYLKTHAKRG
jgi:uncharacterized membrane protein YqjE